MIWALMGAACHTSLIRSGGTPRGSNLEFQIRVNLSKVLLNKLSLHSSIIPAAGRELMIGLFSCLPDTAVGSPWNQAGYLEVSLHLPQR